MAHKYPRLRRFIVNWVTFWEGAAIVYFIGLRWAFVWFAAWSLVATGVAIGRHRE